MAFDHRAPKLLLQLGEETIRGEIAGQLGQRILALIPNVLQEPVGRNLAALLLLHGLLIDEAADRGELQALVADVAIERDLVAVRSSLALAGDKVGEVGLVAAATAIGELGAVATEGKVRIFRRQTLHFLGGAADE